jgi:transposase
MSAITAISDELWDNITDLLPDEKPRYTVGRAMIPFRKILKGILYVLRTGCQWKMLSKEFDSGSTCHRRFQQWIKLDIFKNIWIRLLQKYDNIIGIK